MNYLTLENYGTADILQGYTRREDSFVCLWCNWEGPSEEEVCAHISEAHTHESQFYHFLGADSLLEFTDNEKILYKGLYHQESTNSIAARLGLSPITVRVMKRNLFKRYIEAKATVAFCDKLYENSPKRKYEKKKTTKPPATPIIESSDRPLVGGFSETPSCYPAVVCLFVKATGPEPEFLIADKSPPANEARHLYDVPVSGRVDWLDMSEDCPDMAPPDSFEVSDNHYLTAVRRLGKKQIKMSSRFSPMESPNPSGYKLLASGVTYEKALVNVYLYTLPEDVMSINVCNQYLDTLGSLVTGSFKIEFVSLEQLLSGFPQAIEAEPAFSVGLCCVRQMLSDHPEAWAEKIKALL